MFVNSSCSQLILRKICKIDATRCQILMLKCTKFAFRAGTPDPLGSFQCAPGPLAVFMGLLVRAGKGKGGKGRKG